MGDLFEQLGHRPKPIDEEGTVAGSEQNFSIPAPAVSLPKGGGAISGIDEKFSANPSRGTAGYELPLPFSPSRNGFTPPVRITYDSGAGNGLLGVGWTLRYPSIRCRTNLGLPRYRGNDVYVIAGAEDLVPAQRWDSGEWRADERVEDGHRVQRYKPRIERDFARIERISHAERGTWWRVTTGDNVTTFYGPSDDFRIADPAAPDHVFEWLPAISFDDNGNCVVYEYKTEDLDGVTETLSESNRRAGIAPFVNRHLKRVKYGNRVPVALDETLPYSPVTAPESFLFEAVFDYGEHDPVTPTPEAMPGRSWLSRADAFSSYRSGFEMRTFRLLRRVLMFHRFDELNSGQPCLTQVLGFGYENSSDQSPQATEVSYLVSAVLSGYTLMPGGDYSKRSLPPLEFGYQRLEWNSTIRTVDAESMANLPAGASGDYRWLDYHGEGISGIFGEQAQSWFYKANLGDIEEDGRVRLDSQQEVIRKPSFSGLGESLQLLELEGDGLRQAVVHSDEIQGYFEQDEEASWLSFVPFRNALRLNLNDRNLRRLDVTGDGRADLVLTEDNAVLWYASDGRSGYKTGEKVVKPTDEEHGPALVFADGEQTIFLADMSGDGLVDIVRIRPGSVCYWPNLGYGRFGAKVGMDNAPYFDYLDQFNPDYLHLADVTGTGATDILYLGQNRFRAYLNLSGNAWSDAHELSSFLAAERPNEIAVTDLLGNGTACIVWSSGLPAYSDSPMRYVDLLGGKKPHLLRRIVNNLGKEVALSYKSSTWYYLKDKVEGRPWITKVPFPVHCLRRLELSDRIGGARFTSEFRYHHGAFDPEEREFRGFGMVETIDSEQYDDWVLTDSFNIAERSLHQPPTLTKTWYHTGAFVDREHILTQFRDEYWDRERTRAGFETMVEELELADAQLAVVPNVDPMVIESASPLTLRQAFRSCKGMILRREVFALDSPAEGAVPAQIRTQLTPYSVSTQNCIIELIQPPRNASSPGVFAVKESESITWHYNRKIEDPRIEHRLNVRVDELGNVLEAATISYGRRDSDETVSEISREVQRKTLVTYQKSEFTGDVITSGDYRLRKLAKHQTFEITGLSPNAARYQLTDFDNNGFHVLTNSEAIGFTQFDQVPLSGQVLRRLLNEQRHLFYDDSLFAPLALGQINARALPYECYELAYSPTLLEDIFATRAGPAVMIEGQYEQLSGSDWWVRSGRFEYLEPGEDAADAVARFGMPTAHVDAAGARTRVRYFQNYFLLPEEVTDAALNRVRVLDFDLQRLSASRLRDANDNITEVLLDELGLVKAQALLGKGADADALSGLTAWTTPAELTGIGSFFDTVDSQALTASGKGLLMRATQRYVYDLDRYRTSGGTAPPVVATIHREQHFAEAPDSEVQISFEYIDGLGQVAMTKVQAEPGLAKQATVQADGTAAISDVNTADMTPPRLRWLGTGRKVINNKGNTIREYEPYFSLAPVFEDAKELVQSGVTQVYHYDPIDRLVRTDYPDGSFSRTEFSPWKIIRYDRNDTILDSEWYRLRKHRLVDATLSEVGKNPQREQEAAVQTELHSETPFIQHLGVLGDVIEAVQHNGNGATGEPLLFRTRFQRDIQGQTRAITDARDNLAVTYKYNMRQALVFQQTMDDGARWNLQNVLGDPLRSWDARGHEIVFAYEDPLHRPTSKRVIGGDEALDHVFERRIYGEGLVNDRADNLRTNVAVVYDTAGKSENLVFDFKNNLLSARKRFATDYKAVPDWSGVDPDRLLDAETFSSSSAYDALNRVTRRTTQDTNIYTPRYNAANLLESVEVQQGAESGTFVKSIDYNERGQRREIVFGNDVATTYRYDPETFRLLRLTSRRSDGLILQDLNYTYDPAGNLTHLEDSAVPTVWFDNQQITGLSTYQYDPLYRLIRATGREHAAQTANAAGDNWADTAFRRQVSASDPLAWRNYTQTCAYDSVGNLDQIAHSANGGSWTRNYIYAVSNNQLQTTQVNATTYAYSHDPNHGFLDGMPHLTVMRVNFRNELKAVSTQAVVSGVPETTWYVYDGDGKRVRKVTERAATSGSPNKRSERLYLDGFEIYREFDQSLTKTREQECLHIADDRGPVALIESETIPNNTRLVRYQCINHVRSSSIEVDEAGRVITYEVYHPFGTTAYQAVDKDIVAAAKRYRYSGMERDEESGLEYHSARYYVPWLGRWASPDKHPEQLTGNRYAYVANNPLIHTDTNGLFEEPVHGLLTYRLALAAGFRQDDAARIAIGAAGMDHDEYYRPGDGLGEMVGQIFRGRTHEYHYPSQEDALARVEGALAQLSPQSAGAARSAALDEFGRQLHSLEDVGFKDAPGPHARGPNELGLQMRGLGVMAGLLSGFAFYMSGEVRGREGSIALGIVGGLLAGGGLLFLIFGIKAEGTGHPRYETEIGNQGYWSATTADQAFQDPEANTKQMLRIYDVLKRAAVAQYGVAPHDDVAARQAIQDVVGAGDQDAINKILNACLKDARGGDVPSYAQVVRDNRRWTVWAPDDIDVSLPRDRLAPGQEKFKFEMVREACPR